MNLESIRDKYDGLDFNHIEAERMIGNIYKMYRIENTIIAYRLLYSFILSYGFFKGDEAIEMFEALLENASSYELSEFSKSIVGSNAIEYYEKLIEIEHVTSLHPVLNSIEDALESIGELAEEANMDLDKFQDFLSEAMEGEE